MKRKPHKVMLTFARPAQTALEVGPLSVIDAQRQFPDWHQGIAATAGDGATRCYSCDVGTLYISRSAKRG